MRLRPNSIGSKGALGLALFWFVAVIVAYYAVQKPFGASQIDAIRDLASTVLGWFAAVALANLLGWLVLRKFRNFGAAERLSLQIGLGLGIMAFVVLALGLAGAALQWLLWVLLLLPLPISLYRFRRDLRDLHSPSSRWLAIFVGLALVLVVIRALAPPTAWDSLVYHLTGPKLYQEAGRINHDIDLAYLGFPKAGSMLYLLGLQLAGPELAQLFHATFFLMTIALTFGVVRSAAPGRGWLAAAILVAVPSAALLAGWAYVDWIAAFAGLASYTLIRAWDSEKFDRALMVAAFYAAFALNAKYTSVWLVIGLSLVVLLRGRTFRPWAAFLLGIAAFVAPFLLTNLVLTGNPIYPFFLDGIYWDDHRAFWFGRFGTGLGLPELFAAPWEASIWGIEGGFYEGHSSYGATVGPLLLALIPLVALRLLLERSARQGSVRDLMIVAGVAYIGWLIQLSSSALLVQSRLLLPALPFLAALAAIGFDTVGRVGRWGVSTRFVLGGLVAFVLILTATRMIFETVQTNFLGVVLRAESEQAYLARRLGYHFEAMQEINRLKGEPQVRFLWEPRSYYCDEGILCEPDALLDRWWHDRQHYSTAGAVASSWIEEGVTHVLFYRDGAEAVRAAGFDPLFEEDWAALDRFLEQELVQLRALGDAYILYEIRQ